MASRSRLVKCLGQARIQLLPVTYLMRAGTPIPNPPPPCLELVFFCRTASLADTPTHTLKSPSLAPSPNLSQGLYRISDHAEEARFFHGRARRGLTDPSFSSSSTTTTITSLAPPSNPPPPRGYSLPIATRPGQLVALGEEPPPLPRDLYRGRRRRRPRRKRSAPYSFAGAGGGDRGGTADTGGGGGGGEENGGGGAIDLPTCREVVQRELERLEGDLERRAARLARRRRR